MPGTSTTLSIVLKLVDEASAAMVGVGASMKTIGASMTSAGHTLTQDLTLPIALIGGISLKMSTDFQSAMTLVQTQAGASAAEVKTMSQAILDMSAGGAEQTPIQLAQALFHLESAGLRGSDALKALKASSDLAAVGQTGLEGVTNALVGAYNSGITGASDFQTTVASLNAIVGAGNMRMGDMVAALSTGILPAARSVGISLNDVGAAIALMTSNGIPAEDAATRLRMTLSLMEAPTTKAVKALSEIGITSNQLADDMRSKGLTFAIQDLENHLVNSGLTATEQAQVISHAFGGGRTSSAILTLTQNAKELGVTFQRVNDGMSSFSADVQSQSETSASKFAEGMSKMQDASIKFGDAIRGPAGTAMSILAGAILSISDGFSKLPQSVQTGIVVFLGLLAIIGPILLILGGLFNAIGTLITVFTAIAPIVVGAATAIGIMGFVIIGLVAIIAASAYYIISHWHDVLADAQMVSGLIESYWNDAVAGRLYGKP
jgi:TP901 family phage tail tape measure protein